MPLLAGPYQRLYVSPWVSLIVLQEEMSMLGEQVEKEEGACVFVGPQVADPEVVWQERPVPQAVTAADGAGV